MNWPTLCRKLVRFGSVTADLMRLECVNENMNRRFGSLTFKILRLECVQQAS